MLSTPVRHSAKKGKNSSRFASLVEGCKSRFFDISCDSNRIRRIKTPYTPQNKHGTWKWTLGKGDSYWKPSFPGSMLIFGGVVFQSHLVRIGVKGPTFTPFESKGGKGFEGVKQKTTENPHVRYDWWNMACRRGMIALPLDFPQQKTINWCRCFSPGGRISPRFPPTKKQSIDLPEDSNSVSWYEFHSCFDELNFHGNVPGAWRLWRVGNGGVCCGCCGWLGWLLDGFWLLFMGRLENFAVPWKPINKK